MGPVLIEKPFWRLDRWTEVIGPVPQPIWVQFVGVPLHTWDEKAFQCLGECLGVVMEIDDEANTKQRRDRVRLMVMCDPQRRLPEIIPLEVKGVRFLMSVIVEDSCKCCGKMGLPELCCREKPTSEEQDAIFLEGDALIDGGFQGDLNFKSHIPSVSDPLARVLEPAQERLQGW